MNEQCRCGQAGGIMSNEIKPEDITVNAIKGSSGCQLSGIEIIHMPTALVVRCTKHRHQYKNKDEAIKMLEKKLASWNEGEPY